MGLGLPEVIVAVTVLGAGVLGVAAIGGAARKMANVAAVRSAQAVAAGQVLEGARTGPHPTFEVALDTVTLGPGLIELRVTVGGSGTVGALSWVARQSPGWP
jgi:Tfp pilus assembly protein PilV